MALGGPTVWSASMRDEVENATVRQDDRTLALLLENRALPKEMHGSTGDDALTAMHGQSARRGARSGSRMPEPVVGTGRPRARERRTRLSR